MNVELTDSGIEVSNLDAGEASDFETAAHAAYLVSENLEGRYGEDSDLAAMFKTAQRFANDTVNHAKEGQHSEGQWVDLMLLAMASNWFAELLSKDQNSGGDPDEYANAAQTMIGAADSTFRAMGIQAVAGRLEETEHRYSR